MCDVVQNVCMYTALDNVASIQHENKALIVTMTDTYSSRPTSLILYSMFEFCCTMKVRRGAKPKVAAADDGDEKDDYHAVDVAGDEASH